MTAILETRCGCRGEMEITYPPPPTIVIPLKRKTSILWELDDFANLVRMEVRNFKLREFSNFGPIDSVAVYEESALTDLLTN
jgi:hypothetical protein